MNLISAFRRALPLFLGIWVLTASQDHTLSAQALVSGSLANGSSGRTPVRILLIGDSLSFGPFGEELERLVTTRMGERNLALFSSCGSSPEHWLSTTAPFVTRCGYRQSTPKGKMIEDFSEGRKPRPVKTPKIPRVLSQYEPEIILIQLGTNWMDGLPDDPSSDGRCTKKILVEFLRELREQAPVEARIIWILPPESSKYSKRIQDAVERWILDASTDLRFETTRSREMTGPYLPGKTGRDGVHYSKDAGRIWAERVFWSLYGIRSTDGVPDSQAARKVVPLSGSPAPDPKTAPR